MTVMAAAGNPVAKEGNHKLHGNRARKRKFNTGNYLPFIHN